MATNSGQFLFNFEARPSPPPRGLPLAVLQTANLDATQPSCGGDVAWSAKVRLQAACRAYEEAIRLNPSLAEAHVNVGRLYHEANKLSEAEASYQRAIQHCPELAVACYNLGVVLEDQGRDTASISAYQKTLHLDSNFGAAPCSLAELYERLVRAKDALRHYTSAKRCRPETQLE